MYAGLFELDVDAMMRVDTVHYQTSIMKEYYDAYSDFVILDATHHVDAYDSRLVFTTMVDCLGHTCTGGATIVPTENGGKIDRALKLQERWIRFSGFCIISLNVAGHINPGHVMLCSVRLVPQLRLSMEMRKIHWL